MLRIVGLVLLTGLLIGCTRHGTYVEPEKAAEVSGSVKSAKELAEALGTPSVTIPMGDGTTMWVYEGVYSTSNAAGYVPYLGLIFGRNNQKCTRLTAIVNNESGDVTDLKYETEEDSDFWARGDESCRDEKKSKSQAESAPGAKSDVGA